MIFDGPPIPHVEKISDILTLWKSITILVKKKKNILFNGPLREQ